MTAQARDSASATSLQTLPATPQLTPPLSSPELVRNGSVRSRSSIAKVRLSLYDDGPPVDDETLPPMPSGSSTVAEQAHRQQSTQPSARQRQHRPPALRSIFPQYNPDLPLDEQDYFPTQTSPTRIPRNVISRPLYSPIANAHQQQQQPDDVDPEVDTNSLETDLIASPGAASVRNRPTVRPTPSLEIDDSVLHSGPVAMPHSEASNQPKPSSSDDLRNLWRVASGWKAGQSEGRVFCLKLLCDRDAPVYWLSSSSNQPFYRLRVDPTSTSANVMLSRHDPGRPYKSDAAAIKSVSKANEASQSGGTTASPGSGNGEVVDIVATAATGDKNWQVAMTTTLATGNNQRHPQDGLVALLYPAAAARMALAHPQDVAMVAAAERECARLVWGDDTAAYFLVHPVLALPFSVRIERSTTWSRTVYTLEHKESPQYLARLTRNGTGAGCLEVDTGIASKIDAAYLVDVVVMALLLAAHSDDQSAAAERFAPPPRLHLDGNTRASLVDLFLMGRGSETQKSTRDGNGDSGSNGHRKGSNNTSGRRIGLAYFGGEEPNMNKTGRKHMKAFDLDLESQMSIDLSGKGLEMRTLSSGDTMVLANGGDSIGKSVRFRNRHSKADRDEDKMPGCLRVITALFKCCFWCLTVVARAVIAVINCVFRCLTSRSLV
ncbi:hypothetical protein SEPCBS57363_004850 [Sporothrix epigloea]|uniref:Acetylserotonin methytransferase-like protein n=1 Tax=Sporothrix epigloea TaxID=1892477 RepID=A0ABP0DY78_9PEZI